MKQWHQIETGVTALETAIILIAFVVAAAVFAFAILATGMATTERGKESVYAGLSSVRSSLELRGEVVALSSNPGITGTVEVLVFSVANSLGGVPIDLTDTAGNEHTTVIDYLDGRQRQRDLEWTVTWPIGDGDVLLEAGELAEITVANLGTQLSSGVSTNTAFILEIMPQRGNVLRLQRTTPAHIDSVMTLH